jgi:membrane protein YdbS with pleckstrin-like domain
VKTITANQGRARKAPDQAPQAAVKASSNTARASANADCEWTGSYSSRTMTPSLILCSALTVLLVWSCVNYLPVEWWLLMFSSGLGAIWVMQLVRWGYRMVSFRYRLTSEHLKVHRGWLYGKPVQVPRCQIIKVSISANLLEKLLGVGKVVVEVKDGNPGKVELEGVRTPRELLQRIEPAKK